MAVKYQIYKLINHLKQYIYTGAISNNLKYIISRKDNKLVNKIIYF